MRLLIPILFLACVLGKPSHIDGVTCSAEKKKDCGWVGITKSQCKERGCCYEEVKGDYWCFKPDRPKNDICDISDSKKVDCGYYGIMAEECLVTNGCCWYPLKENSKEPWCYFSNAEPKCVVAPEDKKECGFYGIEKEECEKRGCCYQPLKGNSKLPACYESKEGRKPDLKYKEEETCVAKNSEKEDCGFMGITQSQCEEKGCCYHESSTKGTPWCFKKVTRLIVEEEPEVIDTGEAIIAPVDLPLNPMDDETPLNDEPVSEEEQGGHLTDAGTGSISVNQKEETN